MGRVIIANYRIAGYFRGMYISRIATSSSSRKLISRMVREAHDLLKHFKYIVTGESHYASRLSWDEDVMGSCWNWISVVTVIPYMEGFCKTL